MTIEYFSPKGQCAFCNYYYGFVKHLNYPSFIFSLKTVPELWYVHV